MCVCLCPSRRPLKQAADFFDELGGGGAPSSPPAGAPATHWSQRALGKLQRFHQLKDESSIRCGAVRVLPMLGTGLVFAVPSCLRAKKHEACVIPRDAVFCIHVSDHQNNGELHACLLVAVMRRP